jgi:hypothetical protein
MFAQDLALWTVTLRWRENWKFTARALWGRHSLTLSAGTSQRCFRRSA